ncbi:NADPH-dependent FMN reductase [Castellaniella caeni]|uniref:NADPH-dependent FMN reductase n=1 Tax=Castellaniella caeni TaxID=266123 RepID=UPI00083048EB|nr:NAD(P)H-dependent oxidoreductase [Castellaniella caeni]
MNTILALVGSLRQDSINKRLAKALEVLGADRFRFVYADLGALPHYNDDCWANPPAAVTAFKAQIRQADGILLITPEYFRAPAGLLLNALAWGGRPYGDSAWVGKPVATVGTSPGAIGTAAAQSHLRAILPTLDMHLMGQPEVYFQTKPGLIDAQFQVTDEQTRAFLDNWVNRFDQFVSLMTARDEKAIAA